MARNFINMENIAFVLWLCLFPLTSSVSDYLSAKRRKLLNKEDFSDTVNAYSALIMILIWFVVGTMLYVP